MIARIELQHPKEYEFGPRSYIQISKASIPEYPKYAVIHAIATMMGRIVNPDFYSSVREIFAPRPLKISYKSGGSLKDRDIWIVHRQVRNWSSLSRYADTEGFLECGTIEPFSTKGNEGKFRIEFYVGQEKNQPLNCAYWARTFEKEVEQGKLDELIRSKRIPSRSRNKIK